MAIAVEGRRAPRDGRRLAAAGFAVLAASGLALAPEGATMGSAKRGAAPAPPTSGPPPSEPHAGLVIRFPDGTVREQCVALGADQRTGEELLRLSGLELNTQTTGGGATVCAIEGQGCQYPREPCWCQCQVLGGDCRYWAYHLLQDGRWVYAAVGASSRIVGDGDVDGWAWGPGGASAGASPPLRTFEQICRTEGGPPPEATATPASAAPGPTQVAATGSAVAATASVAAARSETSPAGRPTPSAGPPSLSPRSSRSSAAGVAATPAAPTWTSVPLATPGSAVARPTASEGGTAARAATLYAGLFAAATQAAASTADGATWSAGEQPGSSALSPDGGGAALPTARRLADADGPALALGGASPVAVVGAPATGGARQAQHASTTGTGPANVGYLAFGVTMIALAALLFLARRRRAAAE